MLGLVASGLGVSVVSASMQRVRRDGVVFRPLTGLSVRLPLVVLARADASPRAAALRTLLGGRH